MYLTRLRTARRGERRAGSNFALVACCLVVSLAAQASATSRALPLPPALAPNVDFWTRIYTEVDTQGGLIHDNEELHLVYGSLRFPAGASDRERERLLDNRKRYYQGILLDLAAGQRVGLTPDAQRVLKRFPAGATPATFRRAAENVRFQLGQADKFRAGLIRQGAFRRHIEQTLADHGVPRELVAVPHVESSYNTHAYSSVGAAGLWQFMRSTGRLYLRVDTVVDERLDPFLASRAAARLLRDNYQRLDSWPLAITAYNHGAAGMARAVRELGTRDIGVIARRYKSRSFGFASRNFYSEFLAALRIDQNPEKYFGALPIQSPVDYQTTTLTSYVPARSLTSALGVDLDTLRTHNPALRPVVWNGGKHVPKGFTLRVPARELARPLEVALAGIPNSQKLAQQHRDRLVTVRRGDTLSKIASRYGVSARELVALNDLRSQHSIRVGQVLILPDRLGASKATTIAAAAPSGAERYRVKRGDTLARIASRHGVSERELMAWNGLSRRESNRIRAGQVLRVSAPAPRIEEPAEAPIAIAKEQPPAAPTAVLAAAEPTPSTSPQEPRPVPIASAAEVTPKAAEAAPDPREAARAARGEVAIEVAAAEPPAPASAALSAPAPIGPSLTAAAAAAQPDSKPSVEIGTYRVKRGDAIERIAARHGISTRELLALNGLRNANRIRAGQTLQVPVTVKPEAPLEVAANPVPARATATAVAAAELPASPAPDSASPAARTQPIAIAAAQAPSRELAPAPAPSATPAEPPDETPAASDSSTARIASSLDFERVVDAPMASEESDTVRAGEDPAIEGKPASGASETISAGPDPSNYIVGDDHTITVQADETLGHYAEWLEVPPSRLRQLNRMRRGSTVVIGRTAKLDFSKVGVETFERRRLEYHRTLQEEFFGHFKVTTTETYVLARGDTLWSLANQRYQVPVWLLRQYNPDLDFGALKPGDELTIPRVASRDA
jgi:membrane-bound lytic murein transglycosylase D